jgi:uncharacterized membrane-anchored protein YhcB (DUF1043 family)
MMTELLWFVAAAALVVGFVLGVVVGRGTRYRASRVNIHSAERRQMFIKAGEL